MQQTEKINRTQTHDCWRKLWGLLLCGQFISNSLTMFKRFTVRRLQASIHVTLIHMFLFFFMTWHFFPAFFPLFFSKILKHRYSYCKDWRLEYQLEFLRDCRSFVPTSNQVCSMHRSLNKTNKQKHA